MSIKCRPWFKYYPSDFNEDEKVKALSPIAELIYRRILDSMWQANACRLPNDCQKIFNIVGKGLSIDEIEKAWSEIQFPGFEILKTTTDKKWIYSKRLLIQRQDLENTSKKRSEAGKAGAKQKLSKNKAIALQRTSKQKAKTKQMPTDPDPDIKDFLDKSKKSRASPAGGGLPADFSNKLPRNKSSGHWSKYVDVWFESIIDNSRELDRMANTSGKKFNPWQMVQQMVNEKYHPGAVAEIMGKLVTAFPNINGNVYQYSSAFKKTVKQNWNEREAIEIHEQFKNMDPGELAEMTKGLFSML